MAHNFKANTTVGNVRTETRARWVSPVANPVKYGRVQIIQTVYSTVGETINKSFV